MRPAEAEAPSERPRIADGRCETPRTPAARTAPRSDVGRAGKPAAGRIDRLRRRLTGPGLENGAGLVAAAECWSLRPLLRPLCASTASSEQIATRLAVALGSSGALYKPIHTRRSTSRETS